MPHTMDEVPQKLCSEKVKDHRSTSRVRSLAKRMNRLVATKKKTHLNITQKFLESNPHALRNFLEANPYAREDSKGYDCLKRSARGAAA
jgi:hypothetical protein